MVKKKFKVGEVFQFGKSQLKVIKAIGSGPWRCEGCYLIDICSKLYQLNINVGHCNQGDRKDKTNVIFVKVED